MQSTQIMKLTFSKITEFTQVSADLDKVGDYWPPVAAAVWLI